MKGAEQKMLRKVQYYETDRMGIAHHANYLHWMEEARILFMEELGFAYERMEAEGILSPVRAVQLEYLQSCTFGDLLTVEVRVFSFDKVVLRLGYTISKNGQDDCICRATSDHVFLDPEGHFVRIHRRLPEFTKKIEQCIHKQGRDVC